ncbi:pirin family protein [Ornithinibacter sp.]|uniref:pirin family protein n=1 Tax=Ornithinibacter sp. TaxID=2862748 RepID=UPI002BD17D2A|nr:pirin family protein [Ornithinibacter sp.]HRA26866.1 pirin family protein [Ornithinibacter sp.]
MNDGVQVIVPREVPLGGLRSMTVRRTLPARERSFVGAWCFVDHYGPDDVEVTGGMDVAPHPHCGLATVSWLFTGEVEHRDSLGTVATVRPGEVNLMTAGRGISHSEVSTAGTAVLHGVQLWVVLPAESAGCEPRFEHHVPAVVSVAPGVSASVFVGSLFGSTSPVLVETPLVGAEVALEPGAVVDVPVDAGFELGVLVDSGSVVFEGQRLARGELGVVEASDCGGGSGRVGESDAGGAPRHPGSLALEAGSDGARVVVLGGEPFAEEVVMWWNFIGRSHDEVVAAREEWEASGVPGASVGRFGSVQGYVGEVSRIPAPGLPGVRLRSRGNRSAGGRSRG